jgi:hypothetical protein
MHICMILFRVSYSRNNDDYDDCCRFQIILETGSRFYSWLKRSSGGGRMLERQTRMITHGVRKKKGSKGERRERI